MKQISSLIAAILVAPSLWAQSGGATFQAYSAPSLQGLRYVLETQNEQVSSISKINSNGEIKKYPVETSASFGTGTVNTEVLYTLSGLDESISIDSGVTTLILGSSIILPEPKPITEKCVHLTMTRGNFDMLSVSEQKKLDDWLKIKGTEVVNQSALYVDSGKRKVAIFETQSGVLVAEVYTNFMKRVMFRGYKVPQNQIAIGMSQSIISLIENNARSERLVTTKSSTGPETMTKHMCKKLKKPIPPVAKPVGPTRIDLNEVKLEPKEQQLIEETELEFF